MCALLLERSLAVAAPVEMGRVSTCPQTSNWYGLRHCMWRDSGRNHSVVLTQSWQKWCESGSEAEWCCSSQPYQQHKTGGQEATGTLHLLSALSATWTQMWQRGGAGTGRRNYVVPAFSPGIGMNSQVVECALGLRGHAPQSPGSLG
jgi:hypothetical protein